jgi:hypothetical protein
MFNSNSPSISFFQSLQACAGISDGFLREAAVEVGFRSREPKKISADALLAVLCELSIHGTASYNDLAAGLNAQGASQPSRQAVALRMNASLLELCRKLLACAVVHKTAANICPKQTGFLARYTRILVQDSTILKLPAWLFDIFSVVCNAHHAVCNTRIQAVYDLLSMSFLDFSIDSYSRNDIAAAPSLQLKSGDLVLRDRGYLTADEIARHVAAGADCIYRHKVGTTYLDAATQKPVELLPLLQNIGSLELTVLLNNKQRTPVRLVAAPVDEETAALRRMKAKKETKGHNPSKEVLALMGWTIFITTIPAHQAGFHLILAVYGLRWRIEILFKTWKSHLKFDIIHRVSHTHLRILLCARLLVITALTNHIYKHCHQQMWQRHGSHLSLMKFLNYAAKNPGQIPIIWHSINSPHPLDTIWTSLRKYCGHEKRNRRNFWDVYNALFLT